MTNEFLYNADTRRKISSGLFMSTMSRDTLPFSEGENRQLNVQPGSIFKEAHMSASKKQAKYCHDHNLPHFAPSKNCFSCGQDVYGNGGYTEEYAENHLITRCPFCNKSFVS